MKPGSFRKKWKCLKQAQPGYGLAMLMVFLATTVMIGASMQIMAAPVSLMYLGASSQNKMSAEQLAQAGMDVMIADLQTRYDTNQTIDTSYSFTSSSNADAIASVKMPNSPEDLGGATSTVGSYTGSVVSVSGNTLLLKVAATVGNGSYSEYKLLTLSKSIFSGSNITGATAAYGMRKLVSGYSGPAIRVRRADTNAETDIGFTNTGDLDYTALWSFLEGTNPATQRLITRPLDKVTSASAAFSLRKLDKDYTGAAIKVRRSTDNALLDIGFDPAGNLDINALTNFIGTNTGYVTTFYDQSGSVVDATSPSASTEPAIVINGILQTVSGRPAIKFDGVDDGLYFNRNIGDDFSILVAYSVIAGYRDASYTQWYDHAGIVDMEVTLVTNDFGISVDDTGQIYGGVGNPDRSAVLPSPGYNDNRMHWAAMARKKSTGVFNIYTDQASRIVQTSNTGTLNAATQIAIGRIQSGSRTMTGYINEVLVYPSVLSEANRHTLQKDMAGYWSIPIKRDVVKPLDTVGSAAAAYGLRQLRAGYSGPLIRVRRSSGGEQDIGQVLGDLDVASLLAFVGSGSGYVTTWYDQSDDIPGKNVTQATSSRQPMIVNAGTLVTENGKPALKFTATSSSSLAGPALIPSGTGKKYTYSAVAMTTNPNDNTELMGQNASTPQSNRRASLVTTLLGGSYSFGFSGEWNDAYGALPPDANKQFQVIMTVDNTLANNINLYRDGTYLVHTDDSDDNTTLNAGTNAFNIGYKSSDNSEYWNGNISEILVYNRAISATDIKNLSASQLHYYSPPLQKAHVTKWYDQTGNGNHLTQTNPLQQPVLSFGSDGTAKNRPTLAFNGTAKPSGAFMSSATGFPTNADYTISTVYSYRDVSLGNNIVSSNGVHALFMGGANNLWMHHNAAFVISGTAMATDTLYAVAATFKNSTKAGAIYVGGGQAAAGTGTTATVNTSADIMIGAFQNTAMLNGTISEAIIFNKVLTTDERLALYRKQTAYYGAR